MARKKKPDPPKPRNPFVQHVMFRKAGSHVKSKKAERARDKADLKKERDLE